MGRPPVAKIDDMGLWENSVVVFTTDHGMYLGEHNRTGKSNIYKGDERTGRCTRNSRTSPSWSITPRPRAATTSRASPSRST